jgi:Na+-driven multidrug efflux pump
MCVIFLVIHKKGIGRQFALFRNVKWDSRNAKLIADISGPLVFQHAISIISWVFFYILIEHHGATNLAVSNTMRNVFGFFGVFIWAFASTTNSMVSNVIGQGKNELVIPLINKIALLSVSFGIMVALFLNFFPEAYLSIYGQSDEFIRVGTPVLRLVATVMILMSVSSIWLNAVTGTGNSRVTFLIELFAIILYCSYVYVVLEVNKLSIFWGWASELLYWSCMLALSFVYIKSGRWKHKKL